LLDREYEKCQFAFPVFRNISILNLGAVPDSKTMNTVAIQAAIALSFLIKYDLSQAD
jgi:hypothetical protein